jgi:hypothetical protein
MKEGGDGLQATHLVLWSLAEPQLVERLDRHPLQEAARNEVRHAEERSPGELVGLGPFLLIELGQGRVVPSGQHGAAHRRTPCEEIDPCDRVAVGVVTRLHACHQVVKIAGPLGIHADRGGLHGDQLQGDLADHTREPHATGCSPEDVTPLLATHRQHLPVRRGKDERAHVRGEPPVDVVVLAVDVASERSTHRDVPRPRGHRHEPSERQDRLDQLIEAHPRLENDHPRRRIEGAKTPQPRHVEDRATGVEGRVPVAAPESPCEDAPVGCIA